MHLLIEEKVVDFHEGIELKADFVILFVMLDGYVVLFFLFGLKLNRKFGNVFFRRGSFFLDGGDSKFFLIF